MDEEVTVRSFSPSLSVAEGDGEECVKRALEQLGGEAGVGNHADCATKGDTGEVEIIFVDLMGGLEIEAGVESEGFTSADILKRADLEPETVWEGVINTFEFILF